MLQPKVLVTALTVALVASSLAAQRGGGRGRPEAVKSRVGCYFTDVKLPDGGDKNTDLLATSTFVQEATKAQQPVVLYLADPKGDERKHQQFEQTLFRNDGIGISLRLFRCGRVDVSADARAQERFGKQAPLFVVYGADGKKIGDVPMTGYKAAANPLEVLLGKTLSDMKPPLADFVSKYRGIVNDIEQIEGKKRGLQDRQTRLNKDKEKDKDGAKRAELERDRKALEEDEQKVLAAEKEFLGRFKLVPRDEHAKRLGDRPDEGRDPGGLP